MKYGFFIQKRNLFFPHYLAIETLDTPKGLLYNDYSKNQIFLRSNKKESILCFVKNAEIR